MCYKKKGIIVKVRICVTERSPSHSTAYTRKQSIHKYSSLAIIFFCQKKSLIIIFYFLLFCYFMYTLSIFRMFDRSSSLTRTQITQSINQCCKQVEKNKKKKLNSIFRWILIECRQSCAVEYLDQGIWCARFGESSQR